MALIRTVFSFRTLGWTWTSTGDLVGGGHSCKIKQAREQYPRYNAVGHLVVQNSAGPVYECRFYHQNDDVSFQCFKTLDI